MQTISHECETCLQTKDVSQFNYRRGRGNNYPICIPCEKRIWAPKKVSSKDPRVPLFERSASNAKARGYEHRITLDDIICPICCPYFGMALTYKLTDGSVKSRRWSDDLASLDRIDSSKGYIPGNIQVISYLANRMKQASTPEQLIKFAKGILRIHGQ